MTGSIAHIVGLAITGNDYLRNGKLPVDFYPGSKIFVYDNTVDFRELRKLIFLSPLREVVVSENPVEWFKYLKEDGCIRLRLYFQSSKDQSRAKDHQLAGMVGGGGLWLIEAMYGGYSNYWASRWQVGDQNAPDKRIWLVNYVRTAVKLASTNVQIEPGEVKDKLRQSLEEIAEFASRQKLTNWGKIFEDARLILESEQPEEGSYYKGQFPLGYYSLAARQVLFAADAAWVFGGMGSWNDLGFDDKEDNDLYNKLSEQLYADINRAFISAVNSY